MDTRTMIEERVKLVADERAMIDRAERERRPLNAEEQQTSERRQERIKELRATLDAHALVTSEERYLSESRGRKTSLSLHSEQREEIVPYGPREYTSTADLAFRAWALSNRATTTMLNAAESLGFRAAAPELELRALSVGTTSAGGYSVSDEMMRNFYEAQKWYGRVRNVATVFRTSTGATLPFPVVDDTANTGEIIAEASAVTTTADPVFDTLSLGAFKYSSKAVIVSVELVQDSFINLPQYLGQALGTRIGRIQNLHFTTGAGTTLPFGVATRAALGKTAAATNAITFDEIIDLYHSVDVSYRQRPNTRFMMHDTTASMLRKVKDLNNNYLWETSVQAGQPDRIFGVPVEINNDMDEANATAKRAVLFGDFGHYIIRDATDVIFIRADELRVLNHQVVFLAFQRTDANLALTTAVKYLRTA